MKNMMKALALGILCVSIVLPHTSFAASNGLESAKIVYPYNSQYNLVSLSWMNNTKYETFAYITTINESMLTGETNVIGKNTYNTKQFYVIDDLKPATRYIVRIITQNDRNQPVWVEKVIKTPSRFDVGTATLETKTTNPSTAKQAPTQTQIVYKQTPADRLSYFIGHGVDSNTTKMGIGERSAVVKSFEFAFKRIPSADKDVDDVIRLANGEEPLQKNAIAEKRAQEHFRHVYQRIPDMRIPADRKALMIIAYGMRQQADQRSDLKEQIALTHYKNMYKHVPATTEDWNILQSLAYAGVIGYQDSDKDYLPDYWEHEIGTDPYNQDTDSDGYVDGIEILNGYTAK